MSSIFVYSYFLCDSSALCVFFSLYWLFRSSLANSSFCKLFFDKWLFEKKKKKKRKREGRSVLDAGPHGRNTRRQGRGRVHLSSFITISVLCRSRKPVAALLFFHHPIVLFLWVGEGDCFSLSSPTPQPSLVSSPALTLTEET